MFVAGLKVKEEKIAVSSRQGDEQEKVYRRGAGRYPVS